MSENGEWKDVPKSGKSNKRKSPEKVSEKRPGSGAASNVAKGGTGSPTKGPKAEDVNKKAAEASPAKEEADCPWLAVAENDESDDGAKSTGTPDAGKKKKKNKKKKNKNKDRPEPEPERDAKAAKVEPDKTAPSHLTNGASPDAEDTSEPQTTDKTKPETPEESTEATASETAKPVDGAASPDDTPMSWEDEAEALDANSAPDETESASTAEGEGSSADTTNKEKESIEGSAGKESDMKKKESGEKQKVSFGWHKSPVRSTDKMKAGAPGGDRQDSSEQKHPKPFKKPRTDAANQQSKPEDRHDTDAPKKAKESSADQKSERERDRSRDKRSDSSGKARQDSERSASKEARSRDRSRSAESASSDRGRKGRNQGASGDLPSSGAGPWEKQGNKGNKNNTKKTDQKHDKQARGKRAQGPGGADRQRESRWSPAEPAPPEGFTLMEIKGDLFSCQPDDAMAHCVSEDLEMGKGIAVLFKKSFGGVGKLRAQQKKVGEAAVLPVDQSYVYYLITKERYFHKPSYDSLRSSLVAMRDHCKENNVTSIAMPQIGCGLDKLNWGVVTEIIKEVFKNTGMTIKVYIYSG